MSSFNVEDVIVNIQGLYGQVQFSTSNVYSDIHLSPLIKEDIDIYIRDSIGNAGLRIYIEKTNFYYSNEIASLEVNLYPSYYPTIVSWECRQIFVNILNRYFKKSDTYSDIHGTDVIKVSNSSESHLKQASTTDDKKSYKINLINKSTLLTVDQNF